MKKIVFTYLDEKYPNLYRYLTKFGYDIRMDNNTEFYWNILRNEITETITSLFSCDYNMAEYLINEWIDTLRVVKSVHLNESDRKVLFTYYKITLSPE